jgi:hypothetical protein
LAVPAVLGPKLTVVFVQFGQWPSSFALLAAKLRRSDVRTVSVSIGSAPHLASSVLFNRSITLDSPVQLDQLPGLLASEYVADVQVLEDVAGETYAALSSLSPDQGSMLWAGRDELVDKCRMAAFIDRIGLHAPEVLSAATTQPSVAAAQLGLPVIFKRRIGSGGQHVTVATSVEQLERLVAGEVELDEYFYERFVVGEAVQVTGLTTDAGLSSLAAFRVVDRSGPLGPSTEVEFEDDAHLVETGKKLFAAFEMQGFVNLNAIRDDQGCCWVHDVNPRVPGNFSACQSAGFDMFGDYLRLIAGAPLLGEAPAGVAGRRAFAFPAALRSTRPSGRRTFRLRRLGPYVFGYGSVFGVRFLLFDVLRRIVSGRTTSRSSWTSAKSSGMRSQSFDVHRNRGKRRQDGIAASENRQDSAPVEPANA